MSEEIGAEGLRVLAAIAQEGSFRRRGREWVKGADIVSESTVATLHRRDMVRAVGDRLALTGRGRRWLDREQAGPRLLADRPHPDEGRARGGAVTAGPRRVTVNLAESPLGWLKARGLVDGRQFEAGERLRADWTMAGMGPRVTMRWDDGARSTGDGLDPALAQIAAKRRMEGALDGVGPGLKDVLWRIVCAGEGMEAAERALGWPARAGRVVLTLALDRLADHYRLA